MTRFGIGALARWLLRVVDLVAAVLLAADLVVVVASVISRGLLNAPLDWADDVARGLLVALSFFGAAAALARGETLGVSFVIDRIPQRSRRVVDALVSLLVVGLSATIAASFILSPPSPASVLS